MHLLIIIVLASSTVWSRSVVPSLVVLNPLNLYHKSNKILNNGNVEVKAVEFSKSGNYNYDKKKIEILKEKFDGYVETANAVLRSKADESSGTAFHIGSNLVLTNNHVLDPTFENTTHCGNFRLTDYQNITYDCKEVLYCNPIHDVCLIEMETAIKREHGTKKVMALADGPKLQLKLNYKDQVLDDNEEITTAIGNSGGQGIHYSQGKGINYSQGKGETINKQWIFFYAPIIQGNSGGPLLNSKNEVIGVVKLQSKILINDDTRKSFNIALPADYAVGLIRKGLENNPLILRKFNQAVIE